MIELAIPLFGITAATILAMWNRASIRIAVAVFSAAWLVQLWLLHWIEVASLDTTLHQPHGLELGLFLAVWGISLPAVWGFALRHHSKKPAS